MERLVSGFSRYLSLYGRDYVDLVIVCSYDDVSYDRFVKLLDKLSVRDRVVLTNFVDERELITLYSLAACFIFPSLYEGFGLPVVEAMAAGLPIASSIFSSIPEVLGDSGLYFDPYDSEDIAEVIGLLMPVSAKPVRIRYERNLARAFTWEKTASNTLDVFESVLNGRDSRLGHCAR